MVRRVGWSEKEASGCDGEGSAKGGGRGAAETQGS